MLSPSALFEMLSVESANAFTMAYHDFVCACHKKKEITEETVLPPLEHRFICAVSANCNISSLHKVLSDT